MENHQAHGIKYECIRELVEPFTATEYHVVTCVKCARELKTATVPVHEPVCEKCFNIIDGLAIASRRGFRFGV